MKPTRATKVELRQEICELRHVGAQMANFCFNVSQQKAIPEDLRKLMAEMRRNWDAIRRAEKVKP